MPKALGRHPEKKLTAVAVNAAKLPGRYADGNGLYLVVSPSGAKTWLLRCVVQGRRRDIGLGSVRLVTLAEARDEATMLRKAARAGDDPLAARQRARRGVPTFAEAAERVHGEHKASWRNPKHAQQWINTLTTYAFPIIGHRRVDHIQTQDVLKVLTPIWLAKPETARRVRQRIGTVLDWARAAGFREGENPVASVTSGLPKQTQPKGHHSALPYAEVPSFMSDLRACGAGEEVRLAFEFLILTAARTGEVLGATWGEVDLDAKVWTVPASRMKAKREHRVPLSPRAMAILARAKELAGYSNDEMPDAGAFVFPGTKRERPLSNMALTMVLRRMRSADRGTGRAGVTAHGFR
ncbi:MAG: integrase arm-type DNA-binding domain-containing protein, partial [Pseudomonadota bacterium]